MPYKKNVLDPSARGRHLYVATLEHLDILHRVTVLDLAVNDIGEASRANQLWQRHCLTSARTSQTRSDRVVESRSWARLGPR